jgi:hypothetical protein
MPLNLTKINCITLKIRSKAELPWQWYVYYFNSANFLTNFICRSLSMLKYDKYITNSLIITTYINKTYQHKNKCLLLTASFPKTYPNTFMLQKVIELVDDGYTMRFRHIQVCSDSSLWQYELRVFYSRFGILFFFVQYLFEAFTIVDFYVLLYHAFCWLNKVLKTY